MNYNIGLSPETIAALGNFAQEKISEVYPLAVRQVQIEIGYCMALGLLSLIILVIAFLYRRKHKYENFLDFDYASVLFVVGGSLLILFLLLSPIWLGMIFNQKLAVIHEIISILK